MRVGIAKQDRVGEGSGQCEYDFECTQNKPHAFVDIEPDDPSNI